MLTGRQIRAARAIIGWSLHNLSERSGVSTRTLMRLEAIDDIAPSRSQTLLAIREAFEAAGVEFIGTPSENPGVRMKMKR